MQQHIARQVVTQPSSAIQRLILVVDDDNSIRELLSRVLRTCGFQVYVAESAADAMKLANILLFDAAVIDLALPGEQSGLDLITHLRSHRTHHSLPVLVLTGHLVLSQAVQNVIRQQHAYVFYKGNSLAALVHCLKRITRNLIDPPSLGHLMPSAA